MLRRLCAPPCEGKDGRAQSRKDAKTLRPANGHSFPTSRPDRTVERGQKACATRHLFAPFAAFARTGIPSSFRRKFTNLTGFTERKNPPLRPRPKPDSRATGTGQGGRLGMAAAEQIAAV